MQPMLARQGTSARTLNSAVHSAGVKRNGGTTTETSTTTTLGSAVKLGTLSARDKERKEKEDVELKPPWELLPYSRDPPTGYPDFYLSKGVEEEYKLNEKNITEGFENKPLVPVPSPNETSGAAQDTIGQSMLEKSTLQNFSQFILQVLQQRHKEGLIKTQTTFRVPPRVTLTDQKREQYLRDLATPSQSLRRLARGIPHGIRGRQILEQVCSKNVPINRAIWFIRVINVNELRAVKRKGLTRGAQESVEAKWVIEWTGQVATFLEAVIEECGKGKKVEDQQRWRTRMTYTLRLVTNLYAEQLIDQPTFLKWCLTYIEKSSIEVSPIIVIIIGIFWDDLISRRTTGRKVTEILLDKVDLILKSSKSPILTPVVTSISEKLQFVLLRYPDYLIHPKRWSTLSPVLQKLLVSAPPEVLSIYDQIQLRNANLSDPELRPILPDLEPAQARIVKLLDSTQVPVTPSSVAAKVYGISMDHQLLIHTLCDYAVTRFRPGLRRIYLISSVLVEWPFAEKVLVQEGIVKYFESRQWIGDEMARLILLFTDLLERRVISYSALLRRCIAKGWTLTSDAKGYLKLLVELPIHNVPQSARNTRDMILRRAQVAFDTETQLVEEMIDALAASGLPWLSRSSEYMDVELGINDLDISELEWLSSLTRNAKSVLATTIATRFVEMKAWESQGYFRQLPIVVRILSVIQEFRRLYDVLQVAISNNTGEGTLDVLITTVATYHPPLEGMGVLPSILSALALNWRTIFGQSKPSSNIIKLLTHLHNHLASSTVVLGQLIDEFTESPKSIPLVYPNGPSASPLSDHGIENLAIRDVSSAEEVLRLLTPNGHFDAPLFQRILTATAKECTFEPAGFTSFLELLRASDIAQIEELAKEWAIEGIKTSVTDDGNGVWWVVANLVCLDFLGIEDVISQVVQMVSPTSESKDLSDAQSLELLSSVCGLLCAESGVKLHLSLTSFLSLQAICHRISSNDSCLRNLAILFRTLLTLGGNTPDTIRGHVATVMQSPWMLRTATHHPDILLTHIIEPIVSMGDTPALNLTISAFRSLLGADDLDADFGENIQQIFRSTNEFSMTLCRINLRLVLEYSRLSHTIVGEKSGEMAEKIIASVVGQGQLGKSGDLVKSLNDESKQLLRDHLEKSFLEAAPITNGTTADGQYPEIWSCEKISSAFKLLEATTCNGVSASSSAMDSKTVAKRLLEKVRQIEGLLDVEDHSAPESDFNALVFGTATPPVPSQKELVHCFILCLRILVLRWAGMGVSDSIDLEAWIATLVAFLEHPRISKEKLLVSYVCDIILCFYDELQPSSGITNRLIAYFEASRSPLLETFLSFKRQNVYFDNLVMVKPSSNSTPIEIPYKVWDNIESASNSISENDGPFSLGLFDARERPREHSLWEPEAIRVGIS